LSSLTVMYCQVFPRFEERASRISIPFPLSANTAYTMRSFFGSTARLRFGPAPFSGSAAIFCANPMLVRAISRGAVKLNVGPDGDDEIISRPPVLYGGVELKP